MIKKVLIRSSVIMLTGLLAGYLNACHSDYPKTEITNGLITARIYVPDGKNGYYRSTRFDWSGAVYSLRYEGHEFCAQWFDRIDSKVINWVYDGPGIVSGPCSALYGPVDEFQTPLGWNEAKPGETFIKIGVGVLRRGEGNYNRYVPYDVLDYGKWSVKEEPDAVEFVQKLSDHETGYAYEYHKVIRLASDKPGMVIEHRLINTGQKEIRSSVYNHNFVTIDKQGPGPDYTFRVPFRMQVDQPPKKEMAEVRGNEVVYIRPLAGEDEVVVDMKGFSDDISDTEIIIENRKAGAGMRITGDRPLIRSILWSVRTVLAIEPYIAIDIKPGEEFTWKNNYEYYTIP
jgi:hypothetical protein